MPVRRSFEGGDGNTYTDPYRYGYQGQYSEKDNLTGLNEFELRMYDARFGRWISPDPKNQFISDYLGMANSPIMSIDTDGAWVLALNVDGLVSVRFANGGVSLTLAIDESGRIGFFDTPQLGMSIGGAASVGPR